MQLLAWCMDTVSMGYSQHGGQSSACTSKPANAVSRAGKIAHWQVTFITVGWIITSPPCYFRTCCIIHAVPYSAASLALTIRSCTYLPLITVAVMQTLPYRLLPRFYACTLQPGGLHVLLSMSAQLATQPLHRLTKSRHTQFVIRPTCRLMTLLQSNRAYYE